MRGKKAHQKMEGLDQVLADRVELYRFPTPERLWVPILVQPSSVNCDIPEEVEIEISVLGLKVGRA